MSNKFWNEMLFERSQLLNQLRAIEAFMKEYAGVKVNATAAEGSTPPVRKQRISRNRAGRAGIYLRKKWILEWFRDGDRSTTLGGLYIALKKGGFKCTKHALRQMLTRMPELTREDTGIWKLKR